LIGRILNITTGSILPQYHVVYDDLLTSVPNSESGGIFDTADFTAASWEQLIAYGLEHHIPDNPQDRLPSLGDTWLTPAKQELRFRLRHTRHGRRLATCPIAVPEGEQVESGPAQPQAVVPPVVPLQQAPPLHLQQLHNNSDDDDDSMPMPNGTDADTDTTSLVDEGDIPPAAQQPLTNADKQRTKSGRLVKKPQRLIETFVTRNDQSDKLKPTSYEPTKQ
jgi:hypothetical protein